MRRHILKHIWLLSAFMSVILAASAWAVVHGPDWTIGRAVVVALNQPGYVRPMLYLKLSLRNVGAPGRVWVRIYGRWATVQKGGAWQGPGSPGGNHSPWKTTPGRQFEVPAGMRLLGRYFREVSLNQTAILQVPLTALGVPQRDSHRLEVVVMTASVETDHRFVSFSGYRLPTR